MKSKSILIALLFAMVPFFAFAQISHEGETNDRIKIGRHVWKDQNDQIKAEVVHDDKGVLQSFRTWDDKGPVDR